MRKFEDRVTARWLVGLGACEKQVKLFRKVFPKGVKLNRRNIKKAAKAGLYVGWLAAHMGVAVDMWYSMFCRMGIEIAFAESDLCPLAGGTCLCEQSEDEQEAFYLEMDGWALLAALQEVEEEAA